MRVSCMQDTLAYGVGVVQRAVSSRSTLPVLSNIYICTDPSRGMLKLAATDLNLGITVFIDAEIEEEGEVTVPASLFSNLVKQSPPERIELTLKKSQDITYSCGAIQSRIKGIDPEEFPILPSAGEGASIRVPAPLFREMIDQVAFSASTDDSRPILTGVLFDFKEDRIMMAGADGFRLSVRTAYLEEMAEQPLEVVIPARTLKELGRIIPSNYEGPVKITLTKNQNQILFDVDNIHISAQLIEGAFPDVQRLIPSSYDTKTIVETTSLLQAVQRANIFARDAAHIVRLKMDDIDSDSDSDSDIPATLTISAEASGLGNSVEELVARIEGEPMEIAFNAKYMLEVLKVFQSAEVAIESNSSSAPGAFRPVGGEGFTHVIMPMHIGG